MGASIIFMENFNERMQMDATGRSPSASSRSGVFQFERLYAGSPNL